MPHAAPDPANPFAAPSGGVVRPDTHLGWLGMRSSFPVGTSHVEVHTSHWSGQETYRVDGSRVHSVRNLGWHTEQVLHVRGHTVRVSGRWYPLLPVQVFVDDTAHVDDLFPQLWPIKALLLSTVLPLAAVLLAGTAWDLLRLVRVAAGSG